MKALKKFLNSILFISLLSTGTLKSQFLFTPFENESSFTGTWNLSEEVPNYIAAYLREFYKVNVLSSTAFISLAEVKNRDKSNSYDFQSYSSVASKIGAEYVVSGKVIDFNVSRFSAGETNIAGYEAYSCNINISLQIFNLTTNSTAYSGNVESSVSNKGLGLNLFGAASDEKKQYLALNQIRFGSEEFNKCIVGETMFQLCEDLALNIKSKNRELLFPKKQNPVQTDFHDKTLDEIQIKVEILKGIILTYDEETGEAFINIGSSNAIRAGDELSIYAAADSLFDPVTNEFLGLSDKPVSVLEIVEVRGEKLSLAIVKSNRDKIEKGLEVRKLVLQNNDNH